MSYQLPPERNEYIKANELKRGMNHTQLTSSDLDTEKHRWGKGIYFEKYG